MTSRFFSRAELAALGVPPDSPQDVEYSDTVLADEHVQDLRYTQQRRCIVRAPDDDQVYAVEYEAELAAGDYETGAPPDDHGWRSDQVEAVRVQERPTLVRRWEPARGDQHTQQPTSAVGSLADLYEAAGADSGDAREAAAAWIISHGAEVARLYDDYVFGEG